MGGVRIADIVEEAPGRDSTTGASGQPAGPQSRFDDAVDPIQQMVSLVAAGRAYDGDVAALQAAKQMDVEAIQVDQP